MAYGALSSMTDADVADAIRKLGPLQASKKIGCSERGLYKRRQQIERRWGTVIAVPALNKQKRVAPVKAPGRLHAKIKSGTILVASDAHYWPGEPTTAHKVLVRLCRELKPAVVVMNGDLFDGASVSRHPAMGWESNPTVIQEIETVRERLAEIERAAPKALKFWTLGNHDARFEARLVNQAPEYANVHGVHLKDHFPDCWQPCMSVWINDEIVIKHRFKGGIHATHNNALWAGKTMVTGHLHSLKVTPLDDYNGTRYGIDDGTLADPYGPQFEYQEDNPRNHRSGFAVLTIHDGRLLPPELVQVIGDGEAAFRGKVIRA